MQIPEIIHQNHTYLSSEGLFLKKEIDFLLKILKNCYSSSVKDERIRLLDSYWKSFERNFTKIDELLNRIQLEEKKNAACYSTESLNEVLPETKEKEDEFKLTMSSIQEEMKLLKQSFYEFMQGCNACVLKGH